MIIYAAIAAGVLMGIGFALRILGFALTVVWLALVAVLITGHGAPSASQLVHIL